MTEHNRLLVGSRMLLFVAALIALHLVLFHVLRHSEVSHTVVSGVAFSALVLLMIAKHLGLLAVLLRHSKRNRADDGKSDSLVR